MRIAVFGTHGLVGSFLIDSLGSGGHEVIKYSSSHYNILDTQRGLDAETGKLSGHFQLAKDLDAVVYLSQSPFYHLGLEKSEHIWQVNFLTAMAVLEAVHAAGVPRFVYASTASVYAPTFEPLSETSDVRATSVYAHSKLCAELALPIVAPGMSIELLRPFGIFGPGQEKGLVRTVMERVHRGDDVTLQGRPHHDNDGLKISLCYVLDAVKMIEALLASPPHHGVRAVNIAGDQGVTIRQLAEVAGQIVGTEPRFVAGDRDRETDLVSDNTTRDSLMDLTTTDLGIALEATWRSIVGG